MTKCFKRTPQIWIAAITLLGATVSTTVAIAQPPTEASGAPPAFFGRGPDPSKWYHVIEAEPGPAGERTRKVYERIAGAAGERRDPARLDTIIAYGPGHWTYEWEQEANAVAASAERSLKAGDTAAARRAYFEAARLYAVGSAPHLRDDTTAMAALGKARAAYVRGAKLLPGRFSVLQIPYAGKTFEAYLYLPPGKGPFPVVVASNGSDVVKEQVGDKLMRELAQRGIGLLAIDMPGIGGGAAYNLDPASDVLHVAAIERVRREPGVDAARIAAMGISFGGHAAAHLFLRAEPDLRLRGIVEACGPLHSSFIAPPAVYGRLPPLTVDGVRDRVGLPPSAAPTDLAGKARAFSLKAQFPDVGAVKIATPLLILSPTIRTSPRSCRASA
jgi:esterase FrsA